ncbi:MAG: thiocillin family RiPP [Actinomycetaceae bacterium]
MSDLLDLYASDDLSVEDLPEADALGSFSSGTTVGTFSCPATSASTLTSASSAS